MRPRKSGTRCFSMSPRGEIASPWPMLTPGHLAPASAAGPYHCKPRTRRNRLVHPRGSLRRARSPKRGAVDSPSKPIGMDAGPRPELKAQMDRARPARRHRADCGAVACFAGLDGCAKWLNRSIDPLMTTWARYMASVLVVSALINPWTVPGLFRTRRPWLQAGRSALVLVSTILNFIALQYLQLTETVSIMFATPFIVALLAGPMLGERAGPRRLAAIGVGFLGVLIITRPGLGGMHPAAFLCVIAAVCYALYGISTRVLAAHDSWRRRCSIPASPGSRRSRPPCRASGRRRRRPWSGG